MIAYQQQMAQAADCLAQGELNVQVTPQSEQDALGISFSQMLTAEGVPSRDTDPGGLLQGGEAQRELPRPGEGAAGLGRACWHDIIVALWT